MLRPVLSLVAALLVLAPAGTSPIREAPASRLAAAPKPDTPLATLGSQVIREADFRRYLGDAYPPGDREAALEEYLDFVAVVAKARQEGIDREPRFAKARELMELKLLSHLMTERYRARIVQGSRVSPEEVRAYYEQHSQELTAEPRFTAHHLLVYVRGNPAFPEQGLGDAEARARAAQALAELRAGASWDAVAKTYSDDAATSQSGGLIRDGRFGYFAPEVERAVRTQELGKPGEVTRSVFGYHVVQVQDRVTERVPRPFEEVRAMLTERLSRERAAEAHRAFLTPLRDEAGFELREAGQRQASLLDEKAVAPEEILAEVGGKNILESDFRWFLEDALIPEQRMSAYSRPGARQSMLSSFLDMLVLEAKARKEGLDRSTEFIQGRAAMEERLLAEFMQQRDQAGPFCRCGGKTDDERQLAQRRYMTRVRAEAGLEIAPGAG